MTDATQTTPLTSPVTGLSHVQLVVSDVAASERWYTVVLGLERLAADEGNYVALRHRQSRVVIVLSAATGIGEVGVSDERLDHLAFLVPDGESLRAWAAQLCLLGIRNGGVVDEDGRPSLMLDDPDGIQIELVAPA
jgi:catechol-2,3-dioxygenase